MHVLGAEIVGGDSPGRVRVQARVRYDGDGQEELRSGAKCEWKGQNEANPANQGKGCKQPHALDLESLQIMPMRIARCPCARVHTA